MVDGTFPGISIRTSAHAATVPGKVRNVNEMSWVDVKFQPQPAAGKPKASLTSRAFRSQLLSRS